MTFAVDADDYGVLADGRFSCDGAGGDHGVSFLEADLLDDVAGAQHVFVGAIDIDREHNQTFDIRLDLEFFAQTWVEF